MTLSPYSQILVSPPSVENPEIGMEYDVRQRETFRHPYLAALSSDQKGDSAHSFTVCAQFQVVTREIGRDTLPLVTLLLASFYTVSLAPGLYVYAVLLTCDRHNLSFWQARRAGNWLDAFTNP